MDGLNIPEEILTTVKHAVPTRPTSWADGVGVTGNKLLECVIEKAWKCRLLIHVTSASAGCRKVRNSGDDGYFRYICHFGNFRASRRLTAFMLRYYGLALLSAKDSSQHLPLPLPRLRSNPRDPFGITNADHHHHHNLGVLGDL